MDLLPAIRVSLLLLLSGLTSIAVPEPFPVPQQQWQPIDDHDWNKQQLQSARELFDSMQSSAVMVVHKGQPIVSWGDTATRNNVASVRKSLLSGLYGVAWDSGRIDLNRTLAAMDIQDSDPVLTDNERAATIEHLLLSRSGIFHRALYDAGWHDSMPEPGSHPPGTYWIYNNWDFNALGTIFEKQTGWTIHDAFGKYFAEPLQMQDYSADDVSYETRSNLAEQMMGNSSDHRLYLFHMSPRDLARYGLLYLNKGKWGDQQILSEAWIDRATQGQLTDFDSRRFNTRYGYLWWIDRDDQRRFNLEGETSTLISASGARGHFLLVWPHYDLVLVHATATPRGASAWDQISRRVFGAPNVRDWEFLPLLEAILAAHPDRQKHN